MLIGRKKRSTNTRLITLSVCLSFGCLCYFRLLVLYCPFCYYFDWLYGIYPCSDCYNFLERVRLEGTQAEAKLAVSAIAALSDSSEEVIVPNLCKVLSISFSVC